MEDETTLRLPEGYSLKPVTDPQERRLLLLTRADGSPVAAFELSALGPDPHRVWQIAVDGGKPRYGQIRPLLFF